MPTVLSDDLSRTRALFGKRPVLTVGTSCSEK
jgi:hypothetical protein